jgi:hypothetical protein
MENYTVFLDLGIGFLNAFLGSKAKLPVEVIQAVEAAIAALEAHKDDVITKAALDAQRG